MPVRYDKNHEIMLSYDDVLLIPRRSDFASRSSTDISINFGGKKYSAPIIMSPMTCVTSPEMIHFFIKENLVPTVHRYFQEGSIQYDYVFFGLVEQIMLEEEGINVFDWERRKKLINNTICLSKRLNDKLLEEINEVYFSVGSVLKYKDWIDYLLNKGVKKFCIDMAHGHSIHCIDTIKYLRSKGDDIVIMAGNIATLEAKIELERAGVNSIRANIGSGSACTTRNNTGFGVPSITCLENLTLKSGKSQIIADGGIKQTADMVKAIYFGADAVMIGKLLASTDLAPGECLNKFKETIKSNICYSKEDMNANESNLVAYKAYRGMASELSRKGILKEGSIEGVSGFVRYIGTTKDYIKNVKMNLQSALSYGGSKDWKEFRKNVKYGVISESSVLEGNTHLDIII